MKALPNGWQWIQVGSLAESVPSAITDGPFGSNLKTEHYTEYGPRVIRLQNIGDGVFDDSDKMHISAEHYDRLRKHEALAGDVVVAALGDMLPRACVIPEGIGSAIVKADCVRVRVGSSVDPRFLMWMLNAPPSREAAAGLISGVGRPRLNLAKIRSLNVPLPPMAEQRRIVEAIEEQFSRLDAAEASLDRAEIKLNALRRRCFELTKQTGAPTRLITEVSRIVSGQTPKAVVVNSAGEVPFYKVGDMNSADGYVMGRARSYVSSDVAWKVKLHVWPTGTVIFPKRGGAIATNKKRILGVPGAFDLNTMGLVSSQCLDGRFLLYWLETIDLAALSDGSNVPQINHDDVAALALPVPSVDDQHRVVAKIEHLLSITDRARLEVQHAKQRAQHLRRAILEAAFCGRLVAQERSANEVASLRHPTVGVLLDSE